MPLRNVIGRVIWERGPPLMILRSIVTGGLLWVFCSCRIWNRPRIYSQSHATEKPSHTSRNYNALTSSPPTPYKNPKTAYFSRVKRWHRGDPLPTTCKGLRIHMKGWRMFMMLRSRLISTAWYENSISRSVWRKGIRRSLRSIKSCGRRRVSSHKCLFLIRSRNRETGEDLWVFHD